MLGAPGPPHLVTWKPHFRFSRDEGSLENATERCVGVGACRKASGVMCPSYQATGEEMHSTRGRAHLLWEMLAGSLRSESFQSDPVHEALSLCLSCKACKTECPVQVDMAQYKAEFLAQRYKGRMHPLQHYVFGFADKLARYGSLAPRLTNMVLNGSLTSPLIKRIAGIAPRRTLPRLAPKPYTQSRAARTAEREKPGTPGFSPLRARDSMTSIPARREAQSAPRQGVVLWPDTWNNYYHPQSLAAAESLLSEAGFRSQKPGGPHLLRTSPLRLRSSYSRPRLPCQRTRSNGAAHPSRITLHLPRAKLRQRFEG